MKSVLSLRYLSVLALSIGCALAAIRGYQLAGYYLDSAEFLALSPQPSQCLRPSGRTEECTLSRVTLRYSDARLSPSPVEAFLVQETRSEHFEVGKQVRVAVKPENIVEAEVFHPSRGWSAAIGLVVVGGLLFLVSSPRIKS